MPTGYTVAIAENNCTFREFAMRCSRSFGALIEMRDLPMDAPIPERFEPDSYCKDSLDTAKSEYAEFMVLSDEDKKSFLNREYDDMVERYRQESEKENEKRVVIRQRYIDMIQRVKEWNPPTPDHVNLRGFMLKQLQDSIEWDCGEYKPIIPTREEWCDIQNYEHHLKSSVDIAQEHYDREMAAYEKRNKWLSDLRESLKDSD